MSNSNAMSEIVRFWLEQRHECLARESVPVPVFRNQSDIDFLALRLAGSAFQLPNGTSVGPRLIVESKDEHDWEATGREFADLALRDLGKVASGGLFIPTGAKDVKFAMLRQEHFEVAEKLFGTRDFDRVLVVHALEPSRRAAVEAASKPIRVHWVVASELVDDIEAWYRVHPRPSGLRNTLVGDMLHLLIGFCGLRRTP